MDDADLTMLQDNYDAPFITLGDFPFVIKASVITNCELNIFAKISDDDSRIYLKCINQ